MKGTTLATTSKYIIRKVDGFTFFLIIIFIKTLDVIL